MAAFNYFLLRQNKLRISYLFLLSVFFVTPSFSQIHGGGSVTLFDELNLALTKESLRHKLQTRQLSNASIKEMTTIKTPLGTSRYIDGDLIGCGAIKIGENTTRSIKEQLIFIDGNVLNLESGNRCRER